jgi:hypothetical protein
MKRFPVVPVVTAALIIAAGCAPALAAGRCDSPKDMIDQRACAKAAEGAEPLRRFVERTRMIYGLYYYDFAPGDGAAVAAGGPHAHQVEGAVTCSPHACGFVAALPPANLTPSSALRRGSVR